MVGQWWEEANAVQALNMRWAPGTTPTCPSYRPTRHGDPPYQHRLRLSTPGYRILNLAIALHLPSSLPFGLLATIRHKSGGVLVVICRRGPRPPSTCEFGDMLLPPGRCNSHENHAQCRYTKHGLKGCTSTPRVGWVGQMDFCGLRSWFGARKGSRRTMYALP